MGKGETSLSLRSKHLVRGAFFLGQHPPPSAGGFLRLLFPPFSRALEKAPPSGWRLHISLALRSFFLSHCYRRLYGVAAEHSSRRPSICSRAFSFFSAGRSGSAARRSSLSAAAETTSGTGNEKSPSSSHSPLRSHRLCRPRHAGFFQIASPAPALWPPLASVPFCSNAASGRPRRSRIDAASGCSCFPVHVAFVCAHSLVVACPGSPAATLTCSCSRPCAAARACCSWFSLFSLCIEARATACTSSALSRAFSCRVKQADFAAAKSARPRSSQTRHPGLLPPPALGAVAAGTPLAVGQNAPFLV